MNKLDAFTLHAIEEMDVSDMATALSMTDEEIRASLREAVAAGFLVVDAVTANKVLLRGVFPDDVEGGA